VGVRISEIIETPKNPDQSKESKKKREGNILSLIFRDEKKIANLVPSPFFANESANFALIVLLLIFASVNV
jgi:hypothetical protein